jgi:hypothetical protein
MDLTDNTSAKGAGPFLFKAPELDPGDTFRVDLREVERNGSKRALRQYVPFDSVSVTNASTQSAILATYNGQYDARVLPNTVESFSRQGVAEIDVVNTGSSTIDANDVTLEVVKEPYGADERARDERANEGPFANVLENFTGLRPSDFNIGGGR